ncbi:MAG: hypothetical protein WC857_03845 [Candidatus Paceibacterota bacterium]|jgi:hypothetical protein
MKRITALLAVIALGLVLAGCESEADLVTPQVPILPEYSATFNASPLNLFLPYVETATLWGTVIGKPDRATIYKDGEFYATGTDTVFTAPEPGSWDFELRVVYPDTLITRELTITASEQAVEPDSPLQGMMIVTPNGLTAPFQASISLIGWGGKLPYSFDIVVNGTVYTEPTITFLAELPGNYPVAGTITDADGNEVTINRTICAGASGELPALTLDAFGFAIGDKAYLEAHGSGGDGNYRYRWFYEGTMFSQSLFAAYPNLPDGTHTFTVFLDDGTGNGSTFQDVTVCVDTGEPIPLTINPTASTSGIRVAFDSTLDVDVIGGVYPFTYTWHEGNNVVATTKSVRLGFSEAGTRCFSITVMDAEGHTAQASVSVTALPREDDPIIPMTIAPNGGPQDLTEPVTGQVWVVVTNGSGNFSYRWTYDGNVIGTTPTAEVMGLMAGVHVFYVQVTDNVTGLVLNGDVAIRVKAVLYPPMTIQVFSSPQDQIEPVTASLQVIIQGGSGDNSVKWGYLEQFPFATTPVCEYPGLYAGNHLFYVEVMDNVTGEVQQGETYNRVRSASDPETVCWEVDINDFKVGPNDLTDCAFVTTGHPAWQRMWGLFKFDVLQHEDTIMEFIYTDGSHRFWQVPDLYPQRPAYLMIDFGEADIENVQEIRLIWTGDAGKSILCTGWISMEKLMGCYEIPAAYSDIPVVRLESTTYNPVEQH